MRTESYTTIRDNLAAMINAVHDDQEPIIITRNGEAVAVLMSMAEYESLMAIPDFSAPNFSERWPFSAISFSTWSFKSCCFCSREGN